MISLCSPRSSFAFRQVLTSRWTEHSRVSLGSLSSLEIVFMSIASGSLGGSTGLVAGRVKLLLPPRMLQSQMLFL